MFKVYERKPRAWWPVVAALVFICVTVVLFYPTSYVVIPPWKVLVVDVSGKPLPYTFVRQHWKDYSVESVGHEQDSETDESGYVSFPERTGKASVFSRTSGLVIGSISPHGSAGPHAHILALGELVDGRRLEGYASYYPGEPIPDQLEATWVDLFP